LETSRITEILDSSWGDPQGEFALSPSVLFVVAPDGSGRLFDLEDSFYAVDAVGADMLRRALREDRETTTQAMVQRFGVDVGRIRGDYGALFADLEQRKLVYRQGFGPPAAPPRWRRLARVIPVLVGVTCRLPLRVQAPILLGLARASITFFGWNETRQAWLRYSGPSAAVRGKTHEEIGDLVRRSAAGHLMGVSCKERSLCCMALCRAAGIPASVVLGISLFPLASHCWCESPTGSLTDFADRCEGYTPVAAYA
jgi:hypothetical protein